MVNKGRLSVTIPGERITMVNKGMSVTIPGERITMVNKGMSATIPGERITMVNKALRHDTWREDNDG
jgi:hypothetical protein